MARVTVEDCIIQIPNRFNLVVLAAQRARQIYSGSPLTIDRGDDKFPVLALREIAGSSVTLSDLNASMVQSFRTQVVLDETEQKMADTLSREKSGSKRDLEIGRSSVVEEKVVVSEADAQEKKLAAEFEAEIAREAEGRGKGKSGTKYKPAKAKSESAPSESTHKDPAS
ncbi:MAG: DNA-directed RNA polymerase subunit omega [Pseudomonadota bacterium]